MIIIMADEEYQNTFELSTIPVNNSYIVHMLLSNKMMNEK